MISIIMPCYNTAESLAEAINNIIRQSYNDWELICIDDGSTDDSVQVLKEYSSKDRRIKMISQENKGAGGARNVGLSIASGEYVIFLDSDDVFEPTLLERLFHSAELHHSDISICGFTVVDPFGRVISVHDVGVSSDVFSISKLGDDAFFRCGTVAWNKLIRRKMLINEGILFQNLSSSNDVFFSCMSLLKARSISNVKDSSMIKHITNRQGQISLNRNPLNHLVAINALIDNTKDADTIRKIIDLLVFTGISELRRCNDESSRKFFYSRFVEYISNEPRIKNNASIVQRNILYFIQKHSFNSNWWVSSENAYYVQLKEKRNELINLMEGYSRIVLWGCGKRGKAFLIYAIEEKINLYGVTDKENAQAVKIISETGFNARVLDAAEAFDRADMLIASNKYVYKDIIHINPSFPVINLFDYCGLL